MRKIKRILIPFLALWLLFGLLPAGVSAAGEDPDAAPPLTVEYWITNTPVYAGGGFSLSVSAADAYGEQGVEIAGLIPASGNRQSAAGVETSYWKTTRLASGVHQTTGADVDRTRSGDDLRFVRYYEGTWAYSPDGSTWTAFQTGDQVVAYYMQVTDVTDEIETLVVDWGAPYKDWNDLSYLGKKYVLLDYSVMYESGLESPGTFPNAKTIGFHCDTSTRKNGYYYRTIGMTLGRNTSDFEVYMITVTPSADNPASVLAATAVGNKPAAITYGGTETVAWAATREDLINSGLEPYTSISGAFSYTEGGEPTLNGVEIYRRQAMKVTFYIRAKKTQDSLTVVYRDERFGEDLYSYNVAVDVGKNFLNDLVGETAFAGSSERIDVGDAYIVNKVGLRQTFQTDLSQVPEASARYPSGLYTYTGSVISQDGKTLYLYYNLNLSGDTPKFLLDFGMPFTFPLSACVGGEEKVQLVESVQVVQSTRYGTLSYDAAGKTFTYTPTAVLQGIDLLTVRIKYVGDSGYTLCSPAVLPATTVYYDETFAEMQGFSGEKPAYEPLPYQIAGSCEDNYGFSAGAGAALPGAAVSDTKGDSAALRFTGTGIDLYVNSRADSGTITVILREESDRIVRVAVIRLSSHSSLTGGFSGTEQLGLVGYSVTDLPHGTYTLTVTHGDDARVEIDGYRVYRTLNEADTENNQDYHELFVLDREDDPLFYELRDYVLSALKVEKGTACDDVFTQVSEGDLYGVILQETGELDPQVLLEEGPKNELFLLPGQTVVFRLNTDREVQLGMKAVGGTVSVAGSVSLDIGTAMDMFYTVKEKDGADKTIVITNSADSAGILSLTKVKVCDDPEGDFAALTNEDIKAALDAMGKAEETGEARLVVTFQKRGRVVGTAELTRKRTGGERAAVFTRAEIRGAAPRGCKPVSLRGAVVEFGSVREITVIVK